MVFVQVRRLSSGVEWRPLEFILVRWMDKRWTRRVADRRTCGRRRRAAPEPYGQPGPRRDRDRALRATKSMGETRNLLHGLHWRCRLRPDFRRSQADGGADLVLDLLKGTAGHEGSCYRAELAERGGSQARAV